MRKIVAALAVAMLSACASPNDNLCAVPSGSKSANYFADLTIGMAAGALIAGGLTAAAGGIGAVVYLAAVGGVAAGAGAGEAYSGQVPCGQ